MCSSALPMQKISCALSARFKQTCLNVYDIINIVSNYPDAVTMQHEHGLLLRLCNARRCTGSSRVGDWGFRFQISGCGYRVGMWFGVSGRGFQHGVNIS